MFKMPHQCIDQIATKGNDKWNKRVKLHGVVKAMYIKQNYEAP